MFYKMIETKRNEWLASETCTVKAVIDYIVKTGQMRDAQVEAIKNLSVFKNRVWLQAFSRVVLRGGVQYAGSG